MRTSENSVTAKFAFWAFSEVDIPASCVAPSLCARNSYVEITGSWPCLHKTLSGAGRWIRANFALKLSEKGSEGDSEGRSGLHEAGQTGRKRGSRRSMGPRHGRLWDFSDSFLTEFSEVRA